MKARVIFGLVALLAATFTLAAQDASLSSEKLRLLEDRIQVLEKEAARYKAAFEALDRLFLSAVRLLEEDRKADERLVEASAGLSRAARETEAEIERTVAESRAVIAYLKTKVKERPTLLFTGRAGWHILLGASAGAYLCWEPLPWLGFQAGAELWFTDAFHPAFPLLLTLRLGLN